MNRTVLGCGSLLALLFVGCPSAALLPTVFSSVAAAASPPMAVPAEAAPSGSCLPQQTVDLVQWIAQQPLAPPKGAVKMVPISRGSPRWMAGFNVGLAWENDDCTAFADFAKRMGYEALELTDKKTGHRHWTLVDRGARYNGVFVFRAPSQRAQARPLLINAPHLSSDFADDRAPSAYRELAASVLLQNTAHRCNLQSCSGCTQVADYACGGCVRTSDVAHSVDSLMFAVQSGLLAVRKDLIFEFHGEDHGAVVPTAIPGCRGTVQVSQGSTQPLSAEQDARSFPSRFWQALERKLGAACVCYHQREPGCRPGGSASVLGRLANEEPQNTWDPCSTPASKMSGRFVHYEAHNVPVEGVIAALSEAIPLP